MTTTSPPQHGVTPVKHEASPRSREGRRFPGWRWVAVWLAFPVAGYIGWIVGGRVDAVGAALVGGALTGAGIGAVQWWAADGALGAAQGFVLARERPRGLALPWGLAMPLLFSLGWSVASVTGTA
jgi:hypothetical protein